jgi:hypothetical protein
MSEATNKCVVSFVLDTIYNVTCGKVKTPKCVGLAVLLKFLTGSAHFHYLFLIENLFDSCFGKDQSICA